MESVRMDVPGLVTLRIGGRDGADAYPLDLERTDDGAIVVSIPADEAGELVRCIDRALTQWAATDGHDGRTRA